MRHLSRLFAPPWPLEIAALICLALIIPLFESPKSVLTVAIILGWLLRYFILERSIRPVVALDWAGLARLGAILVAALYGVHLLGDWGRLLQVNHDMLLVVLLILVARAGHSDGVARLVLASLVAGSVLGLGSLVVWPDQPSVVHSAILALSNANVTGFYLALTASITAGFLVECARQRRWIWATVLAVILLAHVAGVAYTGSRSGALMTLTGMAVIMVLGLGWRRGALALLGLGLVAAVIAVSFDSRLAERLAQGFGPEFFTHRDSIWVCGWHAFLQSPWLGYGPDNFPAASGGLFGPIEGCPTSIDQAHNLLLNVMVDTGLLGAAAFVWLVVEVVRRLRAARAIPERSFVVWASGVAAVALVAVGGLVDDIVANEPNYAFGLIVGLAIAEAVPRWRRKWPATGPD